MVLVVPARNYNAAALYWKMPKTGSLCEVMNPNTFSIRRELLITVMTFGLTMLLLPGLIYVVGGRLFGTYGGAGGAFDFYQTTLSDLMVPRLTAWIIVLGPTVVLLSLRLIFHLTRQMPEATIPQKRRPRREPTIQD